MGWFSSNGLAVAAALQTGHFPVHLEQMPSRWAALRGRYYVHLVQMHGPFPNLVRVGVPLFAGLSPSKAWLAGGSHAKDLDQASGSRYG